MPDTLVERDGRLYVVCEQSIYDRPVMCRNYYPLAYDGTAQQFVLAYGEGKIGQPVSYDRIRGEYRDKDGLRYLLPNGGRTLPAFTEEIAYPCPKVRKGIETRYIYGRWQKYLKTQGWTDLG